MSELFADADEHNELVEGFMEVFPDESAEASEDNPEETPGLQVESQRDDAPSAEGEGEAEGEAAEGETEEPPAAEEGQQLIGGKFKSVDELLRAYEHVESHASRMAWERDQALLHAQQQPQQPAPSPEPNWDELIEDRPADAASEALRRGDQRRLAQALAAWEELSPGTPAVWINVQRLEAENRELRQLAQVGSESARQVHVKEEVAKAYDTMVERYPDFEEHREGIRQAVVAIARGGNSGIATALENGPLDQKIEILDQLYHAARSRAIGDVNELARRAAQVHVQETQKAKQEAIVASASSSGQAKPSPADALGQQWENLLAPQRDGWLVIPGEE